MKRKILKSDFDAVQEGATATIDGSLRNDVINTPGVYYIVYNYCTYTRRIKYYYEGTKDRV